MNVLISNAWEPYLAWAAVITAVAGAAAVLVRIIQIFSRSFSDLMNTLEDDNSKLREALSSAESSRTELADQLVRVHKEVAATVASNSALIQRLQNELNDYRLSNIRLLDEVHDLKRQIEEYAAINQKLSDQLAQLSSR